MTETISKIGVREFRNNISRYLSEKTVAITSHGRTVGYYIPVVSDPTGEDLAALQSAAKTMSNLLAENGLLEEDIVADFRKAREVRKKRR